MAWWIVLTAVGGVFALIWLIAGVIMVTDAARAHSKVVRKTILFAVIEIVLLAATAGGVVGIVSVGAAFVNNARVAADSQSLRLSASTWGSGVTIAGDGCTVSGDLRDGKIVLDGTRPYAIATPELVNEICAAQTVPS